MALEREELWSMMTRFHREISLPEILEMTSKQTDSLRNDLNGHLDKIYQEIRGLKIEVVALNGAVKRIESPRWRKSSKQTLYGQS